MRSFVSPWHLETGRMWDGEDEPVEPSQHAGLTEEDLAIDDSLSDVDRVTMYATSHIELQRYVHVKMLSATAENVGFDSAAEAFFPLLKSISRDTEYLVRQQLAIELEGLCKLCASAERDTVSDQAYTAMLNELLPLLDTLLSDTVLEVRISAVNTLVEVAELIREADMMEHVLSIMLRMAHDQDSDEVRITAATLLNNLARTIGRELCHQFVIPELISLSEDPVFRVRKAVSFNMENVLQVAGVEMVESRLLPAFVRLSKDSIWGVRKACADALPGISKQIPVALRARYLIDVEEALANDTSKWVRAAVLQRLGRFLATLEPEMITDKMLDRYMVLASGVSNETPEGPLKVIELERKRTNSVSNAGDGSVLYSGPAASHYQPLEYHVAFSFPAVVFTIGQSGWSRLKPLFFMLVQNRNSLVRRTMACSLHELAGLLGECIADRDLSLACDLFLRDDAEVCSGVLKNIARFLECLSSEKRESYVPQLVVVKESSTHRTWRLRLLLSEQLPALCRLFALEIAYTTLTDLCFDLLNDEVKAVGLAARGGLAQLLLRAAGTEDSARGSEWIGSMLTKVVEMSKASRYDGRQRFVSLAGYMFERDFERGSLNKNVLVDRLRTPLFQLANDQVSNVRLLLAVQLKNEALKSMEGLEELLAKLRDDNNVDVALAAGADLALWRAKHQEVDDGIDDF